MSFLPVQTVASLTSSSWPVVATSSLAQVVHQQSSSVVEESSSAMTAATMLRGGEVSELVTEAYEWCTNLGAPAALVAGAVIATIYENRSSGELDLKDTDTKGIRLAKKLTQVLLLSAFAFETLSIFCTTVTGTMLLSRSIKEMAKVVTVTEHTTTLSFLRDNFEFEYLTARITFLQGLLNWLAGIALGLAIPKHGEPIATRRMNKFFANSLLTMGILMIAFYNGHMNFYDHYVDMLFDWSRVTLKRFLWRWPPRPLELLLWPCFLRSAYLGYQALFVERKEDEKEYEIV